MATPTTSRTIVLAAHIANETLPAASNFLITESPAPHPGDVVEGGVLVQALWLSADPYQRSAMRADRPGCKQVGEALTGFLSGVVLSSRSAAWVAGDLFGASLPLSTVQVVSAEGLGRTVMWKLTGLCSLEELSLGVGVLGMPGATAWGGLLKVLRPEKGQALLVTAASGAVGQLVGQIARNVCECSVVVGTAGGPAKCAALTERFSFTHAIDYKALGWEGAAREARAAALAAQLKAAAPAGLDMVFENVGGATFEAGFRALGKGGRVAVCGGIEGYGSASIPTVSINVLDMIYTGQRVEGFVCSPWLYGISPPFLADMAKWRQEGKLVHTETVFEGLEAWPEAFASLFTGANNGKVVVRV